MQSISELLNKKRVEELILDIEQKRTCVLIKPYGVKLQVSSPPKFSITNKGKSISTLDLITSDLYVTPYMHIHKIKAQLKSRETYELIYNYGSQKIYLASIKSENLYINDYSTLNHRAELYNLEMPIIDGLSMKNLISLISAPELNFGRFQLNKIADAIIFLNSDYQVILKNPHKEKTSNALVAYNKIVDDIFKDKPNKLSTNINSRFLEILDWAKIVKSKNAKVQIKQLGLPNHVTKIQDFTSTFLPSELTSFLKASRVNLAIFRTILFILAGKGFNKDLMNTKSIDDMKQLSLNLSWEI